MPERQRCVGMFFLYIVVALSLGTSAPKRRCSVGRLILYDRTVAHMPRSGVAALANRGTAVSCILCIQVDGGPSTRTPTPVIVKCGARQSKFP